MGRALTPRIVLVAVSVQFCQGFEAEFGLSVIDEPSVVRTSMLVRCGGLVMLED